MNMFDVSFFWKWRASFTRPWRVNNAPMLYSMRLTSLDACDARHTRVWRAWKTPSVALASQRPTRLNSTKQFYRVGRCDRGWTLPVVTASVAVALCYVNETFLSRTNDRLRGCMVQALAILWCKRGVKARYVQAVRVRVYPVTKTSFVMLFAHWLAITWSRLSARTSRVTID